jgi:hypothetical protein
MAGGIGTTLKRHLIALVVLLVLILAALCWLAWLFLQSLL